jgi:hypothetical protein
MERKTIQNKIHEIRGRRVMLDFDLAALYGIETKMLKRAVRRNMERFEGDDFMFEVTREELSRCQIGTLNNDEDSRSQFVTLNDVDGSRTQFASLNKGRGSNIKYLPFAFTELGVAMLSSVLHSDVAIEINRNIMRAFVALRQLAMDSLEIKQLAMENGDIRRLLEEYIEETEEKFDEVYAALTELAEQRKTHPPKPRNPIGYIK